MSESNKFWETERIVIAPETPEEWGPVWSEIGGEFRSRSGNREGSIYVNHQGLVAIRSISRMIKEHSAAPPQLPEDDFRVDGMTLSKRLAFLVADQLMSEAKCWSGKAREGLNKVSDVVGTAVADAFIKYRNGVAVIDMTSPSSYGYSPSLRHKKGIVFHEGTHVWQYTLNERNLGLISEEEILADPEYPVLARALGGYYEKMTPKDVYSEAMAWGVAGEGWNVGLYSKARTEAFLGRLFRAVKRDYGQEALEMLHLVHPHVKRVLDHVKSESIGRDVGRGDETASGKTVEGGGRGVGNTDGTGEAIPGASRRDEASPGSLGQGRDDGPDEVKMRLGISLSNGDRALELASALKTIAAIDHSNHADTRSWGELAATVVGTARAAVAGLEHVEVGKVGQALMEIAKMDPAGGQDAKRSCKEVTVVAVGMARAALAAISQDTNVRTDVAMGVAETALDAPSNGRPPAQGMSW